MSFWDLRDFIEKTQGDAAEKRARHLDRFVRWFVESGLSPLDYYLVEERRPDGAVIWSFQRKDTDPPQSH